MSLSSTAFKSERRSTPFLARDPYQIQKWATAIGADILHRISPKWKINLENMGRNTHI
jgi:hypothetical protein